MKRILKCSIILLMLICFTACGNSVEKEEENKTPNTASEKMMAKISELVDDELAYKAGSYKIGKVKSGEYAFVSINKNLAYYREKDKDGFISDNNAFHSFGYVKVNGTGDLETDGILVSVKALDKLGVTGAKELYEILNEKENYNEDGYYKVGFDIEPGKYIIEQTGNNSVFIDIMPGPVGCGEMGSTDMFKDSKTFTLKKGQYIEISNATITKQ